MITCKSCGLSVKSNTYPLSCVCGVKTHKEDGEYRPATPTIPLPGKKLTELIPDIFKSESCGCEDYAKEMDIWGVKGCEDRFNEIVKHLYSNAKNYLLLNLLSPITRSVIKRLVTQAINECKISIVWVYWHNGAEDQELLYSMRSASTNLDGVKNLVLCGDNPGWFTGDFIHCPKVTEVQFGPSRYLKWVDSINKLNHIIESDLVTENFLWLYDDTFIVAPTTTSELSTPSARGLLHSGNINTPVNKKWREVMRQTAKDLITRGFPQRNYSTHYPVVYNKTKLKETIKLFDVPNNPRVIESLYMNHHYTNPGPVLHFDYNHHIHQGWSPRKGTKVVNVGGFNKHVQSFIKPMFPQKLPCEIS